MAPAGAKPRLIVGMSGASGVVYGVRMLEMLRGLDIETHLVMSRAAEMTLAYETDWKPAAVKELASVVHPIGNIGASISSGSFRTMGMVIAPCSMKTLAEIATGSSTTLLTRAADVVLKERRRLVLMARETPLHGVHLRNMLTVTDLGGIVAPPVPAFYSRPKTLDEMIDHSVGRVLDLFDLDTGRLRRWGEEDAAEPGA